MKACESSNWSLLKGLFPKWDPNEYESRLFRQALRSRRADLIQTAIEDFRTFFKYTTPSLGGILKEYSRLVGDLSRSKSKSSGAVEDGDAEEEAYMEELLCSRAKILLELEMMDDESVKAACDSVKSIECLSGIVGRIKGPVSDWSETARGLVWAKAAELNLIAGSSSLTPRPSLSPVPE
jgi:hypothetical protein